MVLLNTVLRKQSGPFDAGIAVIQGSELCGSPSSTRYRSKGKGKTDTVFNSSPYHEDLSAIRKFCTRSEWSLCIHIFHDVTAPSGPGPPHCRGITITLRHITVSRTFLNE